MGESGNIFERSVKDSMEQELKIKKYGIVLPKEDCMVRMVSKQPLSKNIRKHKGIHFLSADLRKAYITLP
jgi:hypothetical protein